MIDYSFEVQQKTALPSPKNPLLTQRETSNYMSHYSFTTE